MTSPGSQPDDLRPARESLFALLPRRSLYKAIPLVLLLLAIIFFKHKSHALVRLFVDLAPPQTAPAASPTPAPGRGPNGTPDDSVPSSPPNK